jgi:mycofactocin biosynthesis protein MftB
VSTEPGFDLDRPWRLDERVAIRPEPFGALLYHFGTRRLSFVKNPKVLAVVTALDDQPTARAACEHAGVTAAELDVYAKALAALARSSMIAQRRPSGEEGAVGCLSGQEGTT